MPKRGYHHPRGEQEQRTFPTAASPRSTSLTLLLGFGAFAGVDSDIVDEAQRRDGYIDQVVLQQPLGYQS
jgi:hypothetical protein